MGLRAATVSASDEEESEARMTLPEARELLDLLSGEE